MTRIAVLAARPRGKRYWQRANRSTSDESHHHQIEMIAHGGEDVETWLTEQREIEPLYAVVAGGSWALIAAPIRRLHAASPVIRARGRFRIEHGDHPLTRLLIRLLRLPHASDSAETTVVVTRSRCGEVWHRTLNGRRLETHQGRAGDSEIGERFGVLEFRLRLRVEDGSLLYSQRGVSFRCGRLRIALPRAFAPRVDAREDPAGPDQVYVQVQIALPVVGPLISYGGTIHLEGIGQ